MCGHRTVVVHPGTEPGGRSVDADTRRYTPAGTAATLFQMPSSTLRGPKDAGGPRKEKQWEEARQTHPDS